MEIRLLNRGDFSAIQAEVPPLLFGRGRFMVSSRDARRCRRAAANRYSWGNDLPLDRHHLGNDLLYFCFLQLLGELDAPGDGTQGGLPVGVADEARDMKIVALGAY